MTTRFNILPGIALFCLIVIFPKYHECLRIGVLLSSISDKLTICTIQLAVEKVKSSPRMRNSHVDVIFKDTSCDTKQALGISVDLLKSNQSVDLILGPPCLERKHYM